jgi:hypothetical protein
MGVGGKGNGQQWNQSRAAIPLPDIPLSYPPCIFVLKTRAFKIGRLKLGAFLRWDKKPLISRCLTARTFRAPLVTLLKTEENFERTLNEHLCFLLQCREALVICKRLALDSFHTFLNQKKCYHIFLTVYNLPEMHRTRA